MMQSPQPNYKDTPPPAKPTKRGHLFLTNTGLFVLAIGMGLTVIYGFYLQKSYKIPTASMEPTLVPGDHIITFKYFPDQKPGRGDIVVFPLPTDKQQDYLKRIVGLPGEKLEIRQQKVYINNAVLSEPYAKHTEPLMPKPFSPRDDFPQILIPDEQFFVLGDNRDYSHDSRHFGLIHIKDISRKVKWIYWSWIPEEGIVRWERIGKSIE